MNEDDHIDTGVRRAQDLAIAEIIRQLQDYRLDDAEETVVIDLTHLCARGPR